MIPTANGPDTHCAAYRCRKGTSDRKSVSVWIRLFKLAFFIEANSKNLDETPKHHRTGRVPSGLTGASFAGVRVEPIVKCSYHKALNDVSQSPLLDLRVEHTAVGLNNLCRSQI